MLPEVLDNAVPCNNISTKSTAESEPMKNIEKTLYHTMNPKYFTCHYCKQHGHKKRCCPLLVVKDLDVKQLLSNKIQTDINVHDVTSVFSPNFHSSNMIRQTSLSNCIDDHLSEKPTRVLVSSSHTKNRYAPYRHRI